MDQKRLLTNHSTKESLIELLEVHSKHSSYQELHPSLLAILGLENSPVGKREARRWEYMVSQLDFANKYVLDIGANTGYFSFAALSRNASTVKAYEGNKDHAYFLRESAKLLGEEDRLMVYDEYFSFDRNITPSHDLVFCLNVLHHLGDDFDSNTKNMDMAKKEMGKKLRHLANHCHSCWFQIGFNWKGDRSHPLFPNGLKHELISFVKENCEGSWSIKDIALYNPDKQCYEPIQEKLLRRFDNVGEFLNRPLFFLKSLKI